MFRRKCKFDFLHQGLNGHIYTSERVLDPNPKKMIASLDSDFYISKTPESAFDYESFRDCKFFLVFYLSEIFHQDFSQKPETFLNFVLKNKSICSLVQKCDNPKFPQLAVYIDSSQKSNSS